MLESAGEGIYGVDTEGHCTFANRAATNMLGFAREELLGADVRPLLHADRVGGEPIAAEHWVVLRVMQTGEGVRVEDEMMVRRDGTQFCAEYSSYPVIENGVVTGAVVVFRDVTEAHEMAKRLSYQATHDALTGLVNRREFERRVTTALQEAHVDNTLHGLIFLDLDQFKIVNDTCGHSAGDEMLRQISGVLQGKLRSSDTLALGISDDLYVTIPRGRYKQLKPSISHEEIIKAPVEQGHVYGTVKITLEGETIAERPLMALQSVEQGGWWKRFIDYIKLLFQKLFG